MSKKPSAPPPPPPPPQFARQVTFKGKVGSAAGGAPGVSATLPAGGGAGGLLGAEGVLNAMAQSDLMLGGKPKQGK
jgi:hypothetical protein